MFFKNEVLIFDVKKVPEVQNADALLYFQDLGNKDFVRFFLVTFLLDF